MNASNIAKELGLVQLTKAEAEKEVTGAFIGDLLSVVMSKCDAGDIWITVQTHENILSVADLNDAAGIIIAGGGTAAESLIEKADSMGIALFKTEMEAYELAWKIHEVI